MNKAYNVRKMPVKLTAYVYPTGEIEYTQGDIVRCMTDKHHCYKKGQLAIAPTSGDEDDWQPQQVIFVDESTPIRNGDFRFNPTHPEYGVKDTLDEKALTHGWHNVVCAYPRISGMPYAVSPAFIAEWIDKPDVEVMAFKTYIFDRYLYNTPDGYIELKFNESNDELDKHPLKIKMDEYFSKVKPEELVAQLKEMGYEFEAIPPASDTSTVDIEQKATEAIKNIFGYSIGWANSNVCAVTGTQLIELFKAGYMIHTVADQPKQNEVSTENSIEGNCTWTILEFGSPNTDNVYTYDGRFYQPSVPIALKDRYLHHMLHGEGTVASGHWYIYSVMRNSDKTVWYCGQRATSKASDPRKFTITKFEIDPDDVNVMLVFIDGKTIYVELRNLMLP